MPFFNLLASDMFGNLEWRMIFILVITSTNFGVDDDVCIQTNLHTMWWTLTSSRIGSWHQTTFTIWMRLVYFIMSNQIRNYARKSLWVQDSGRTVSLLLLLYILHAQHVDTGEYLHISTPKMLWKVVANKLSVMVCKPNGMDDVICIWELDGEPKCTFQI